jgi:histidine triad (HIT) family protein
MVGCVFCRILAGAARAHVVLDEPDILAILDHRPLFPGHVLVMPRQHHETLVDLPGGEVGRLFAAVRRLADAVERGCGADGTFVAINNRVSQSVPHLHVHVVPRKKGDGLRGFFWPRVPYRDEDEAARVAADIRAALSGAMIDP